MDDGGRERQQDRFLPIALCFFLAKLVIAIAAATSSDAREKFVRDFAAAWVKVMNADRFADGKVLHA